MWSLGEVRSLKLPVHKANPIYKHEKDKEGKAEPLDPTEKTGKEKLSVPKIPSDNRVNGLNCFGEIYAAQRKTLDAFSWLLFGWSNTFLQPEGRKNTFLLETKVETNFTLHKMWLFQISDKDKLPSSKCLTDQTDDSLISLNPKIITGPVWIQSSHLSGCTQKVMK